MGVAGIAVEPGAELTLGIMAGGRDSCQGRLSPVGVRKEAES